MKRLITALLACTALTAHASEMLRPVDQLDLELYLGEWHAIAKAPERFMSRCATDTRLNYKRTGDGMQLDVTCLTRNGKSEDITGPFRIAGGNNGSGQLEVRFGPAILAFIPGAWGDYWVVDIDADYSMAIVSEPYRAYMWALSRTPEISDERYDELLERLETLGFDRSTVVRLSNQQD